MLSQNFKVQLPDRAAFIFDPGGYQGGQTQAKQLHKPDVTHDPQCVGRLSKTEIYVDRDEEEFRRSSDVQNLSHMTSSQPRRPARGRGQTQKRKRHCNMKTDERRAADAMIHIQMSRWTFYFIFIIIFWNLQFHDFTRYISMRFKWFIEAATAHRKCYRYQPSIPGRSHCQVDHVVISHQDDWSLWNVVDIFNAKPSVTPVL